MATLVVVNEPLVTGMVNDRIAQRCVPSFRPCRAAPDRLATAHDARKEGRDPWGPSTGSRQNSGASASQFRRYRLIDWLIRLGDRVRPECESPRIEQVGDRDTEAWGLHFSQSLNSASLIGSGKGQAGGAKHLGRPLFQRRPLGRRSVAPNGFRALPRCPGLLSTEVLVGVVHQGVEPALGPGFGETVRGDPLFQRFPNRKVVPLFSSPALQEPPGTETATRTVRFLETDLRFPRWLEPTK